MAGGIKLIYSSRTGAKPCDCQCSSMGGVHACEYICKVDCNHTLLSKQCLAWQSTVATHFLSYISTRRCKHHQLLPIMCLPISAIAITTCQNVGTKSHLHNNITVIMYYHQLFKKDPQATHLQYLIVYRALLLTVTFDQQPETNKLFYTMVAPPPPPL